MIVKKVNKSLILEKKYLKYETSNMSPNIKIKWKKASGYYIYDDKNKRFIDFTSGIFASSLGYKNKRLNNKIKKVLSNGFSHNYNFYNDYREKYISKLIKFVSSRKLKKCFLTSAGTEATETALKLARIYGSSINKKKIGVISIKGNWHGRTMGSQMMSGKNNDSSWVGYYDKYMHQIDFPYPWVKRNEMRDFFKNSINKVFRKNYDFKNNISMIILETFQGWGAVFYPVNYVKEIEKFCKKNNIILCFDEMQSGFARTGKKFGFQHYKVNPDMICCGKGMGAGFSLSGVIGAKKLFDNNKIKGLSSTHSANPISCAAGLATIEEIEASNLVENSRKQGALLHKHLVNLRKKFNKIILNCLGNGLIGSIIFQNYNKYSGTQIANMVSTKCLEKGLLVCNTGRESIKLGPPLIIDGKGITRAVKILRKSVEEIYNEINQ